MRSSSAFSIIELLVTFAIVAILSVVAIPAYNKYTIRSKVATMVSSASAAQLAVVSEYFDNNYTFADSNHSPGSQSFLKPPSNIITSMEVDKGWVRIDGDPSKLGNRAIRLVFQPVVVDNDITWSCFSSSEFHDYVPPECRNSACTVYTWGAYSVIDEGTIWMYNTPADAGVVAARWASYCGSIPWYYGCECNGKTNDNLTEYTIVHDFDSVVDLGGGFNYLVVTHSCRKRVRELTSQGNCDSCPVGATCQDVFDKLSAN